MSQRSELIAKIFGLLAESTPEVVSALGSALTAELVGVSELADRRSFRSLGPWPPRYRAVTALEELRVPSKDRIPSAFEFGVMSANNLVQNLRIRESMGLELTTEELEGQCGKWGRPIPVPEWRTKFQIGMLAGLAVVPAEDRAELSAIDRAKDLLTNAIAGAL